MLNFNTYLMRHGEFWLQGIIEQIERVEGIRTTASVTLEDRWDALMQPVPIEPRLAA